MDWNKLISDKRERESKRETNSNAIDYKDTRNSFDSDFGRVIFSPALRRMHDKTQVFPLNTDDNVHTRLTHSLETMSVAKGFGLRICDDPQLQKKFSGDKNALYMIIPTLLSTAALVHDIGNPPFGHFGEEAIQLYFKKYFEENDSKLDLSIHQKTDFTKYNGNAQGLRILSKTQVLQDTYGLNLTHAVYSVLLKYPNTASTLDENSTGYKKKLGVFQSESNLLENIFNTTGIENIRNPLTFFLEASDDICYRIMDIEDGIRKKYYSLDDVFSFIESCDIDEVKDFWSKVKIKMDEIDKYNQDYTLENTNIRMKKLADFRSFTINKLAQIAFDNFKYNIKGIEDGSYTGNILETNDNCLIKKLEEFENKNIFPNREIHSMELTGLKVIHGLLDHFVNPLLEYKIKPGKDANEDELSSWKDNKDVAERLLTIISNSFKHLSYFENDKKKFNELSDYDKLRIIVDFVSGMTDQFALKLYQKLHGISLG